ncbi:MAG: hypothetical protein NVSMB57_13200 [Actinomycetota bacterium]
MLPAGSCTQETAYDQFSGHYGAACRRMHIVFGPINVKPGQNDILIQPVTIEKPQYDGYMVRFKPNLIDETGVSPRVQDLHLHHGTWLNANRSYGSGPWLATGEEKTVVGWPQGYGLKILHDDQWLFLHMVHNATAQAKVVWATYDIDFISVEDGDRLGIKNTKGIWLDVGGSKFHPKTETYPFNPIYNVQRGFGHIDPETGHLVCSFPKENCARFNSMGHVSAQQGLDVSPEVKGWEFKVPKEFAGTLVLMGGHLHTGGIRDEIELVRGGQSRMISISDAYYWDHQGGQTAGAPPTSWDFSMTGSTAQQGWKVNVQAGDIIRLNAVYDTTYASWYENMGIVMTWISPGEFSGIDPFDPNVKIGYGLNANALRPGGTLPGSSYELCHPSATTLCVRGQITHGHIATSGFHGDCLNACPPLPAAIDGPLTDHIEMAGYSYGIADMGVVGVSGIPVVKLGKPVTFTNADTAIYMWHTVTRCALPCTGPTTVDYPIANGGGGVDDFDSTQLGVGLGPTNNVQWSWTPRSTGTFTFFCHIHPPMRGVIKVIP